MSILQARIEAMGDAPIEKVWAVITDISLLPAINPGIIKASGIMNELNAIRTCEVDNGRRKGQITEKLVEFVPKKRKVWRVESDTMGMGKMLRDTQFVFLLEEITDSSTKVIAETHYTTANLVVWVMNGLMMKKMFAKAQEKILGNIRTLIKDH